MRAEMMPVTVMVPQRAAARARLASATMRAATMYDIGFNWYWTQYLKFTFDFEHTEFNRTVLVRPGPEKSAGEIR